MPRVIAHLDMDAFFASVEQRENPSLQGKPVIVGGDPKRRGVVCAASYEARKFGIRSAMPSSMAHRLCPQGIFIHPRMQLYRQESRMIMGLVEKRNVRIEQVSIDEAYLDVTSWTGQSDPDAAIAACIPPLQKLRAEIRDQRALTASMGLAGNKMLAKIASDFCKPDGFRVIYEHEKAAFLRPMPVEAIHGVGKATRKILNDAGYEHVSDLQGADEHRLKHLLGSWGSHLKNYANGIDERPLSTRTKSKSLSTETTFPRDTDDRRILRTVLREQARELADALERKNCEALTIQIKVRYGDFSTLTRQVSLEEGVSSDSDIYRLSCFLLARDKLVSRPLRLIGMGAAKLREPNLQLKLPLDI